MMAKRIGTLGQSVNANTDRLARGLAEAERRAQDFADRVAALDAGHKDEHAHAAEAAERKV